jgi:hypothetical protein
MAQTIAELKSAGIMPLTDPERGRLVECERVISKGLGTFLEVGQALAEIYDNRLYRETHKGFKRYCKDVWGLGKTTAEQKINSYKVVRLLEEKMPAIAGTFSNEFQLRPITRLKGDDDRLKAGSILQEKFNQTPGIKLTGAMVNKAVKEVKGETQKRKIKETQRELEATELVSKLFKTQWQVMMNIITEEQDAGWQASNKKEVVKWLEKLIKTLLKEEE